MKIENITLFKKINIVDNLNKDGFIGLSLNKYSNNKIDIFSVHFFNYNRLEYGYFIADMLDLLPKLKQIDNRSYSADMFNNLLRFKLDFNYDQKTEKTKISVFINEKLYDNLEINGLITDYTKNRIYHSVIFDYLKRV